MPTATIKINPSGAIPPPGSIDQDTVAYFGSITFSAATDTYATGGLLALTGFGLINLGPYSDRTPITFWIESLNGSGIWYAWNIATSKLKLLTAAGTGTAGVTEITNGTALNAVTPNVFTDTVAYEVRFPRK
ncbi:MAG: hypothetical protein HRJ53_17590 [Acidobacteria bacterium Pan2503]|uniref:Uncharacterized protein n=1 Tax=Candidatus Acidiferrum panamense TaxID=2741543 RepID=A0A7V8NSR7_9BACT|nr:hypothetical protein [Candidatus Acidoferrum panamensis]